MLMLIGAKASNEACAPLISIHLMLMLIKIMLSEICVKKLISIHLMLMLIKKAMEDDGFFEYFNTSHVNVNLSFQLVPPIFVHISIHLMLMLILTD